MTPYNECNVQYTGETKRHPREDLVSTDAQLKKPSHATGAEAPSSKQHFEQFEGFHLLEHVLLRFGQAPCPLPLQVPINHLRIKRIY